MEKYDLLSDKAQGFINPQELNESLEEGRELARDPARVMAILEKAKAQKGLSHREAAVLLMAVTDPSLNDEKFMKETSEKIFALAEEIKEAYYGNRIVLFAPLYLSNYCVNGCVYCPYHIKNKTIVRKKMTQEEIKEEVIALQDMGHKRLALESGEHPLMNPLEYILESIDTIYSIKHKSGAIRRVNVNIAATTIENYKRLHEAQIGTYILFQETYNQQDYEALHPYGPKSNYNYHTEAMDRAMTAGIEDVGIGVLFGLHNFASEFIGLLMQAEHLEAKFGAGPHTVSVPRLCPADDINTEDFKNALPDDIFLKIIALLRISIPYTGMIVSTREKKSVRAEALRLGVSQISGGSKTSVGGYAHPSEEDENSAQFEVSDTRTLDEVVRWLIEGGYVPSFCTSCYGNGRVGKDFMKICKAKEIFHCCTPNALLTLKEYLDNYGSEATRLAGNKLLEREMGLLPPKTKNLLEMRMDLLKEGKIKFF